ncbi:hypothetical protein BJV78DRAFT_1352420 [Lactifluus subvellereus]|nr:hypothetical protein BJV78DRAFT_1352420 [Lactifluus subvellereus]
MVPRRRDAVPNGWEGERAGVLVMRTVVLPRKEGEQRHTGDAYRGVNVVVIVTAGPKGRAREEAGVTLVTRAVAVKVVVAAVLKGEAEAGGGCHGGDACCGIDKMRGNMVLTAVSGYGNTLGGGVAPAWSGSGLVIVFSRLHRPQAYTYVRAFNSDRKSEKAEPQPLPFKGVRRPPGRGGRAGGQRAEKRAMGLEGTRWGPSVWRGGPGRRENTLRGPGRGDGGGKKTVHTRPRKKEEEHRETGLETTMGGTEGSGKRNCAGVSCGGETMQKRAMRGDEA